MRLYQKGAIYIRICTEGTEVIGVVKKHSSVGYVHPYIPPAAYTRPTDREQNIETTAWSKTFR